MDKLVVLTYSSLQVAKLNSFSKKQTGYYVIRFVACTDPTANMNGSVNIRLATRTRFIHDHGLGLIDDVSSRHTFHGIMKAQ